MTDIDKYKLKQCILYLQELNESFEGQSESNKESGRKKKIKKGKQ